MSPFLDEEDGEGPFFEDAAYYQNVPNKNTSHLDIVALLTQVAETHDLNSVQSIKLKVMTKDLPLHSLHTNLPGLKELDLESSNIHSLRELGTDLRSLQVLRLGHCRLESLDGILAFKSLKEFSAPNNYITNLGLASQLPHIIYFDISRNFIDHWNQLSFFKDASTLEEINFQGNPGSRLEGYRDEIIQLLQQLVVLDGRQIDGREHRKTSPVLRARPPLVKSKSGRRALPMNEDLCGNLTAALAQNKKRQKISETVEKGNTHLKANKLSEPEAMLKAAITWKESYDNYLKNKN